MAGTLELEFLTRLEESGRGPLGAAGPVGSHDRVEVTTSAARWALDARKHLPPEQANQVMLWARDHVMLELDMLTHCIDTLSKVPVVATTKTYNLALDHQVMSARDSAVVTMPKGASVWKQLKTYLEVTPGLTSSELVKMVEHHAYLHDKEFAVKAVHSELYRHTQAGHLRREGSRPNTRFFLATNREDV